MVRCTAAAVALLGLAAAGVRAQRDAVKLETITALSFREGKMSAAGRTAAVPQLKCVGGSAMSPTTAVNARGNGRSGARRSGGTGWR